MKKISPTDWKTQVRVFEKNGCTFVRQSGDHLIFHHPAAKRAVVIPRYDKVPVTIILNNMKTIGMTREDYLRLLDL